MSHCRLCVCRFLVQRLRLCICIIHERNDERRRDKAAGAQRRRERKIVASVAPPLSTSLPSVFGRVL